MEAVPASLHELMERASNSFDESFKKASNSFDESFKQIQSKYVEVVGSTNPFVIAPIPNFSNDTGVAADKTQNAPGRPVPRFHDYAKDPAKSKEAQVSSHSRSSFRSASKPKKKSSTSLPFKTYTRASPARRRQAEDSFSTTSSPTRKPFDEFSDCSNSIVQSRQQQQDDEDRLSDEETHDTDSKMSTQKSTIDTLLGYKSSKTITRSKRYITQPVGVDFVTLNTQMGTMLIVSCIKPTSIFAMSDLKVGDAILSINGVSFGRGGGYGGGGDTNICKPDVEIARKLVEKGWDGLPRDHRGRNNPGRRRFLQVTLQYRKFGGRDEPVPSRSTGWEDYSHTVKLASSYSTIIKSIDDTTYVAQDDDENDEYKCSPDPCSSAAAAAVIAVTSEPTTPSKKGRKSLWGPAKAFLNRNRTQEQTPKKSFTEKRSSPTDFEPPMNDAKSTPSTPPESDTTSRLTELRAKNQKLRASSNQQIEASKKRLLSTHIKSSSKKTDGGSLNYSCDSPDTLEKQLDLDTKQHFHEEVDSITTELLSNVRKQQISRPSTVLDTASEMSEDQYNLARCQQEALITIAEHNTSMSPDRLDNSQVTTEDKSKVSSQRIPPKYMIAEALLDDEGSWTTLELLENEIEKKKTAQKLGEHHQELTRLNRKVSDKLRSKIDLLKRSNMKLSEEIASLRLEDKKKSDMLASWQKQKDETETNEESLKNDVELYQSRLRDCSLQADKRQQELMDQIEKQRQSSKDRVELLLERINSLERGNKKLMSKVQTAEMKRISADELQVELKKLRKTVDLQSIRIQTLLKSNDELRKEKQDLKQRQAEMEENSEENVVAEIEICAARSNFLERQVDYLRKQLKCAKEDARHEREKRLFCQHELEDALVKLSEAGKVFHEGGDPGTQPRKNGLEFLDDIKSSTELVRTENKILVPMELEKKSRELDGASEEKKTMDTGDR